MVVEVQNTKVTGTGSGSGFVYSFSPLVINKASELQVTHVVDATGVETLLSEGVGSTNYAVTVSLYPGTGSITYPADSGTEMPAGEHVVMKRILVLEQQTNLETQGGYDPEVQETQFDKLVMIDLQQQEEIDRAVSFPLSYTGVVPSEIPAPSTALYYLRVNAAGTALAWTAASSTAALSSDADPLAAALAALPGTAANFAREDHVHPVINTLVRTLTGITLDDDSNNVHAEVNYVKVRNVSGGTLTAGTPLYSTGYNTGQDRVTVDAADADVAAKMPAIGILESDLVNNGNGHCIVSGTTNSLDTSSYSAGTELYVSATVGTLTSTRPTGTSELVQKIAVVIRSHASAGRILVHGAGRTNALPNSNMTQGADIASAATLVIGTDGERFDITGNTGPITAFTVNVSRWFVTQFDSTPTLTHHATNLILPGAANITAAAGDIAIWFAHTANKVECLNYQVAAIAPGDGGAKEFISTTDFSSEATGPFTGFDANKYDGYEFDLQNIVPVTDAAFFWLRTSTDGGSNYDAGASDYKWSVVQAVGGVITGPNDNADNEIELTGNAAGFGVGSAASEYGISGVVRIYGPHLTKDTQVTSHISYQNNSAQTIIVLGTGIRLSAADVDAVQFLFSTGNIESGTITMSGFKNS